jgi:hypothetical protein
VSSPGGSLLLIVGLFKWKDRPMQTDLTFIMGHIMAAQHKVDALESLIRNECGYSQDNLLKQIAKQAHALANHAVTIQTLAITPLRLGCRPRKQNVAAISERRMTKNKTMIQIRAAKHFIKK